MNAYMFAIAVAAGMLLLAALISSMISYQGGANPKDPGQRKLVFWIFCALTPVLIYLLGVSVIAPADALGNKKFMDAIGLGTGAGLGIYLVAGFVLAKVFKNGKIGNWF